MIGRSWVPIFNLAIIRTNDESQNNDSDDSGNNHHLENKKDK